MPETTYIVLSEASTTRAGDSVIGWREVDGGPWTAATPQLAIRAALGVLSGMNPKPDGTYVAVPARSWKPVTVTAVQSTVLKLDPT